MPDYFEPPKICDILFGTVCASAELGMASALRWARCVHYGHPLMLLDWETDKLSPQLWKNTEEGLLDDASKMKVRLGDGPHLWVEGAALAHQALAVLEERSLVNSHVIPEHVVSPNSWDMLVLSSAFYMRSGQVKMSQKAFDKTKKQNFGALSFRGGPRTDDPTIAAFIYGVVLALDPSVSRPPRVDRYKVAA